MGSIYRYSILNIAATGFRDGEKGLFNGRDANLMTPIHVFLSSDQYVRLYPDKADGATQQGATKGNHLLVDVHVWRNGVDRAPLCKRGWVTQERALSVRTLHFGSQQLFWECMSHDGSEVFPEGFVVGTRMVHPKYFLSSREKDTEERLKSLQKIRSQLEGSKKRDEDHIALKLRSYKLRSFDSSDDDSSSEEIFPESEPKLYSPEDLGLYPEDFEGCDLDYLDGLQIKDWDKFKNKLRKWGVGKQADGEGQFEPRPMRGMTLAQRQWRTVIKIFSRCALSFSKDKLVAISGMARTMADDMNCRYLAGMWRKDLEHQLLWKVTDSMPAVKKDGTRGPSWAWPSVDGPIKIPDWQGYFYSG